VIRDAWRALTRFLRSAKFATVLLVVFGVWSMLGSILPQGGLRTASVATWARQYPALEPIVRALGLHSAFSSPVFIALAAVLGVSTALCAWQRTKVALKRAQEFHRSSTADSASVEDQHDFEIPLSSQPEDADALSIASRELEELGVKTKRRGDVLSAVSRRWAAWGSPIFHWALLSLLLALLVGNSLRSEGLMGVVVGQIKPDAPQSYGVYHQGPLHGLIAAHRYFRVDAFEIDYQTGGVDRGPTPTVSLLDAKGKLVKQQRVYPNHTLKSGALTVYPSAFGLAVTVSEVDPKGRILGSGQQLVDFSEANPGHTVPAGALAVLNSSGKMAYRATATVPLDIGSNGALDQVPQNPSAAIVVTDATGKVVARGTIKTGEQLVVPDGTRLLVDDIDYYARLQIVDDWTVPLLYTGLFIALVGLAIATLARQQILLVTTAERPEGPVLLVRCRMWRNASTSRSEIESRLREVLGNQTENQEGIES
jgi:cytochrome c biogenesis protein ResB